jgi:hypothetical protein
MVRWNTDRRLQNPLSTAEVRLRSPGLLYKVRMRQVRPTILMEGVRVGVALAVCVVVVAVLSLTPSLSWLPEPPLLGAALLLPLSAFTLAGYRAGKRSGRVAAGAIAGAVAGVIAGGVGGLSYVFFGKPVFNVAVGLVLGSFTGALVGTAAAWIGRPGQTR